jgi:hypothetical protein
MPNEERVQCPCYDNKRSTFDRPELFIPLLLLMFVSSIFLFTLADLPYGIPLATIVPYTALIILTTFSAQRGQQPYFFECSIVGQIFPRLVWRHGIFLAAILALEAIALHYRSDLPAWWLVSTGKDGSPFTITLCILCGCIAFTQILSNRSLLDRAHVESDITP